HRDIKPDNIFLHRGEKGEVVKVVDFGIAKLMEVSASLDIKDLTAVGRILGTPAYIAPERFEGEAYDGQADIYSLGVMLYEMLCGRLPFQSDARGLLGLARIYLQREPISLREINPLIPEAIEAVVVKTLEKEPDRRPTAKELG